MFASIRKYDGIGNITEITLAAKEQLFPLFERQPGFISYTLVDTNDQSVTSLTIFETREQSEAANTAVRELVRDIPQSHYPKPGNACGGRRHRASRPMNVGTEIVTIAERARPTTDAVRQPAWPARRVRHDPHRNGVAAEAIMGHSRHRTLTTWPC